MEIHNRYTGQSGRGTVLFRGNFGCLSAAYKRDKEEKRNQKYQRHPPIHTCSGLLSLSTILVKRYYSPYRQRTIKITSN
jgi:hypothetical protein